MNAAGDVPLENSITSEGKYKLLYYWLSKVPQRIGEKLTRLYKTLPLIYNPKIIILNLASAYRKDYIPQFGKFKVEAR